MYIYIYDYFALHEPEVIYFIILKRCNAYNATFCLLFIITTRDYELRLLACPLVAGIGYSRSKKDEMHNYV